MEKERRRRIVRIASLSALGVGVLWFVIALDSVFGPLLLALLIAYILNPVVNSLVRARIPRAAAIGLLFLLFYACLTGFLILTFPAIANQAHTLYQNTVGESWLGEKEFEGLDKEEQEGWLSAPEGGAYLDDNENGRFDKGYVRSVAHWLESVRRQKAPSAATKALAQGLEEIRDYLVVNRRDAVLTAVDTLVGALFTVFGILTTFILVPIYLFYFLMGLSGIWEWTVDRFPGHHRVRILHVLGSIDESVSAFFRGRLIIMVIKGVIAGLALWLVGLPYPLVLGVASGVGSLIPIAGFLMGILPGIAIALLDVGSPGLAGATAAIFLTLEIFEVYMLGPWILKDRVGLHPLVIVVSVFAAGALLGFIGMLLAVPITAVVKILFEEFVDPEIVAFARESPE